MMHIWPGEDVFELWAIHKGPWVYAHRTRVAAFLSEESAASYLRKSRLKKPTRDSAFRKSSLLWGAQDAEIELVEGVDVEPCI